MLKEINPKGNGDCMSPESFEYFWNHLLMERLNKEKNNKYYDNDIFGNELNINNYDIDSLNPNVNNNIINNQINTKDKKNINPKYIEQFFLLKNMGFKDDKLINQALFICQGNLENSIEFLIRNHDFEENKK